MPKREIARRLGIDVKTVRRTLRKQTEGASRPNRTAPPSKLQPYHERVAELFQAGRTAWSIYSELAENPTFPCSYEIVKRYVRELRQQHPKVYERLEHPAGEPVPVSRTPSLRRRRVVGEESCHKNNGVFLVGNHCCPAKNPAKSTDSRHLMNHFRYRTAVMPMK